MDSINLSMGRTVQIIDYKDSVKYHVSISFTRDVEGGEAVEPFLARAKAETARVFGEVEEVMLQTAKESAEEQVETNPSFGSVNEFEPLKPRFSEPKRGKRAGRRPPPRRGS